MIAVNPAYRPRLADRTLADLLADFPAILVNGARAVGKTTTARQFASDEVRLDQPSQAAAFRADPDAALRSRAEPLLIDEWQEVPSVLGAVKRAVDDDPRPGRFILTGSVRSEWEHEVWPGTGRLVRLTMYGLTRRELGESLDHAAPLFLDRLTSPETLVRPKSRLDLPKYIDLALESSFPEIGAATKSTRGQIAWLRSYVDQLLTRDAPSLLAGVDIAKMRIYFEALALNTAGLISDKSLYDAAGINAKTASRYDQLFAELFVTEQINSWSTNRLARLEKRAKRYFIDPALAAATIDADRSTMLTNPDLLGRLLDTFVVAQLRPEFAVAERPPRLHHLRTANGRQEIDFVVETTGGHVFAFEVKASAAVTATDAKHLVWLRDEIGKKFVRGVVLHTGPDIFELSDRILAIPICAIWS